MRGNFYEKCRYIFGYYVYGPVNIIKRYLNRVGSNIYLAGDAVMLKCFYPDRVVDSVFDIDFTKLYGSGKRGLLFDIDNTLVEHGADSNEKIDAFFAELHKMGFKTCLISNNDEERVARFNKNINTGYIYKAGKPSGRGYILAIQKMGVAKEEALFVGDQLFTDIYGAKRIGLDNICVRPISPKEEIQIVLKRKLEKIVYASYNRYVKKTGEKKLFI